MNAKTCIRIDGCRCKKLSFKEILRLAADFNYDLDLTTLATGAGTDCGTCYPWLKRALATQQSLFLLLATQENQKLAQHFGTASCPKDDDEQV
jgi:bacterioferritin-associated ferredoxin